MIDENRFGITDENVCRCSRSPTGKCIGWHSLSNEDYDKELKKWNSQQLNESAPKFLTEG